MRTEDITTIGQQQPTAHNAEADYGWLEPRDAEYLRERAVPSHVAKHYVHSLSAETVARLLGLSFVPPSGGLGLWYSGIEPQYWRVRLRERMGDGVRWLAPKGRTVPVFRADCPGADSGVVVVVEGGIKALAVSALGINAIGLGGTATCLDSKGGVVVPNDSWPALVGLHAVLAFDANRLRNPDVAWAEARLALALEGVGVRVSLAQLPIGPGGEDWGPDDFIAACGPDAFRAIVEKAVPANPMQRVMS